VQVPDTFESIGVIMHEAKFSEVDQLTSSDEPESETGSPNDMPEKPSSVNSDPSLIQNPYAEGTIGSKCWPL
jgi:hypothetical protein